MICCPGNGTSTSRKTGQTKKGLCVWWPRGWKSPSSMPYPPPLHHYLMSTIFASIVFTFHALLSVLHPCPLLPDSSCSISSSSRPTLPPQQCLSLGASELPALPPPLPHCVSDILLFEEINPPPHRSRRRLPQSEVHVEKKLLNQLRFGLFYKLNERLCTQTVSTSLLCSYSRPHRTRFGIP